MGVVVTDRQYATLVDGLHEPDEMLPLNLFVGPIYAAVPNTQIAVATIGRVYAMRFQVSRPVTVSTARFVVGTQSGNLDIGILASNGDRLGSTGSFACPASSSASQALTGSVNLEPGVVYYAALAADNTTATFSAFNYGVGNNNTFLGTMGFLRISSGTTFPIQATNTLTTGTMRPFSIAFT